MGKSRVKGTRPAYDWALPDVQLLGSSLCECLRDCLENVHPKEATYPWPALALKASELLQISDSTAFCKRPMSRQQFLQCFRGFLCRALVPPDQASAAGYNRLRPSALGQSFLQAVVSSRPSVRSLFLVIIQGAKFI